MTILNYDSEQTFEEQTFQVCASPFGLEQQQQEEEVNNEAEHQQVNNEADNEAEHQQNKKRRRHRKKNNKRNNQAEENQVVVNVKQVEAKLKQHLDNMEIEIAFVNSILFIIAEEDVEKNINELSVEAVNMILNLVGNDEEILAKLMHERDNVEETFKQIGKLSNFISDTIKNKIAKVLIEGTKLIKTLNSRMNEDIFIKKGNYFMKMRFVRFNENEFPFSYMLKKRMRQIFDHLQKAKQLTFDMELKEQTIAKFSEILGRPYNKNSRADFDEVEAKLIDSNTELIIG